MKLSSLVTLALALARGVEAVVPATTPGTFTIDSFTFDTGETLANLTIHYQTIGQLRVANGRSNAVLVLHSTTGLADALLVEDFAGQLFNPGQVLDTTKYFIILPDAIGHGNTSKPSSTGLRARFPGYQYSDMVRANYRLVTEHLGIPRLRLVMGVSMGGMHTWLFGTRYPTLADALMPIACLPAAIAGQNREWRKFAIELIRHDPAWQGGDYTSQPVGGLGGAVILLQLMGNAPLALQHKYPNRTAVDAFVDGLMPRVNLSDANDVMYAWNSSATYNPEPDLGQISVPLTAVNTADDMINPPALGIFEHIAEKIKPGLAKTVLLPLSNDTVGHGSYLLAKLWKDELADLLTRSECQEECLVSP
ncbi:Alpha/Beta hydrolase protein [Echria macrotheca]|uniref:Alpha/Beta hydrolase protein n=1 Tax=Echria macrotheca TaxID=438768 RepID=A0AAJ0F5H2_9PEZI|nr:Alpha/Beta hydrolase protein [Echria macrotheca]